jgi:hypothetical protein
MTYVAWLWTKVGKGEWMNEWGKQGGAVQLAISPTELFVCMCVCRGGPPWNWKSLFTSRDQHTPMLSFSANNYSYGAFSCSAFHVLLYISNGLFFLKKEARCICCTVYNSLFKCVLFFCPKIYFLFLINVHHILVLVAINKYFLLILIKKMLTSRQT